MNDDILDAVDKKTGPRTCPECGYEYPFKNFVRLFIMSYGMYEWPCHNCGERIKCDAIKVQMMWMLGIIITGLLFGAIESKFELGLLSALVLIPFFAYALLVLFFVKFKKQVNKK